MRFSTAIACISSLIIGVYGLDWFGSQGQYKCHCSRSLCLTDGQCGVGSQCEAGWFGPACQYQDLVTKGAMTLTPSRINMNSVRDRDDFTCVRNLKSIQMDWDIEYPFTWMRVVLNDTDFSKELSVHFSISSTLGKKLPCQGQQISRVNNRTKDIYCFLNETVSQVSLVWTETVSLCSFYVSGGRNVALKQPARQSSNYYSNWAFASAAVDGDTSSDFGRGSCTHTKGDESDPNWEVFFSNTVSVNRFLLYNRASRFGTLTSDSDRLQNFVLRCFTVDNKQVCASPQEPETKLIYTIVQLVKEPVSSVRIIAKHEDKILTLCEVEIFGDVVCKSNFYGLECNSSCNCKDKSESCFVATGGCPSGCAPGYYEEGCKTACPPGSWGSDCLLFCNVNCVDHSCNKENGECDKGCDGYSDPPHCQTACDVTSYGVNCLNTCPVNCNSDGCNRKNGACFGCRPGYQGTECDQVCEFGKYGQKCTLKCSNACLKNGTSTWCGNVDGRCLHGCNESYTFQDHDECSFYSSQDGSPVPLAAVVAPVVLIVLVLLILVVAIVLIRRKRQEVESKAQVVKHIEKNDFPLQKESIRETSIEMDEVLTIENASKEETEYFNSTPEQQKTSIAVTELNDFLLHHQKEFFIQQFQSIPAPKNVTMEVGTSELNMSKNRFKNIITYDHSRVHLKINTDKHEGDYINASYVEGYKNEEKYIASQGPNNAMINDFVRMLWEQKVEKVVMLTNLVENGKAKCDRYWPTNEEEKFGSIKIRLTTTQIFADYTIRRLELIKKGSSTQTFMQFHFTTWPDKGVPSSPWGLVDFEQRVASYPTEGPIVVHCSAGVGRTGTFIALRNIMREAEDTGKMDFFYTISKLRQDRMLMIQTAEQYEFLHRSAQVAMVCIGTTITAKGIANRIKHLETVLPSGKTLMEKEYEDVCNVSEDNHLRNRDADSEENTESIYQNKETFSLEMKTDRSLEIKPKERYRVQLAGDTDFINAVIVPSFTKSDQQILTHLPTSATVMEFWKMIIQYQVSLVLAFEVDAMVGDESLGHYLPSSSKPIKTPQFEVHMESLVCEKFWEEKKLKVVVKQMSNARSKEHTVTHVKCTFFELDPKKVLSFLRQARSYNALKDGVIVYMCRNGAKYCGLACVLTLLMDRMDNDLNLTVPLVVGCLKTIRPEVIPSLVQYRVLYQVLLRYRETSASYTNFGDSKEKIHQSSDIKPVQENETEADDDINIYANT
ncbi:unnamed protein product [Lymnaea stagnalis]|uniref:protein-tyrosine-phosphatase n=1 Tax=Lymnaea stagnalis TaxID=6523 RepID=A0AAV2HTS6_LYMST